MISACPNCGQTLNLNEGQQQKIENALASLAPGKSLKFNCPHCLKPIELQAGDAAATKKPAVKAGSGSPSLKGVISPPAAPALDWLERGDLGKGEVVEDVPQVLILIKDESLQGNVVGLFEDLGYKAVIPQGAAEAIELMRFTSYEAVVLHTGYEGSLAESTFHASMQSMSMTKRRYIFYVLMGPELHSMYNLEALSQSANLVVNEKEITAFPLILKKGFRDYDELFGPYLSALQAVGKK